jgi:hypothetical protein
MCNCKICKRSKAVRRNLNKIENIKTKKFFTDLYEEFVNIDFELECCQWKDKSLIEFLKSEKLVEKFWKWKCHVVPPNFKRITEHGK